MKLRPFVFLVLTTWFLFQSEAQEKPMILIYGSDECGHCLELKKSLDSAEIAYVFHDIEKNSAREMEMVEKFRKYKIGGDIRFPVAEINDKKIVTGADFRKVVNALKE